MLTVISPAKSLDFKTESSFHAQSDPALLSDTIRLMSVLKKKTPNKLKGLMEINDAIAQLNFERNQSWSEDQSKNTNKAAMFAFRGEVYLGLDAGSMTLENVNFANDHLRILSGLYGVLRPLDTIQPYRLEMGTQLKTTRGKNLYAFWKDRITDQLNDVLGQEDILLNLASNEYFKAVNTKKLNAQVVTPIFKDEKNGNYKVIFTYAKRARGLLSRFIIDNQIDQVNHLKAFDTNGYYFSKSDSSETELVFLRDH